MIAKAAGVSVTTASLVLNKKSEQHRIKEDTRIRVEQIAKKMDYQPHAHAQALRTQLSKVIGLIVPDLTNTFAAQVANALEAISREHGYLLLIADSHDDTQTERHILKHFKARGADGLIIASSDPDLHTTVNLPFVQLDRNIADCSAPCVDSNNEIATHQLITNLLDTGFYQTAPIFIGGLPSLSTNKQRWTGFSTALQINGMQPHKLEKDFSTQWGYDAMKQLSIDDNTPCSLFTASMSILEGVLRYLSTHGGLHENHRLATFDNHPLLDILPIRIPSIQQNYTQLAHHAFEQLIACMHKQPTSNHTIFSTINYRLPY